MLAIIPNFRVTEDDFHQATVHVDEGIIGYQLAAAPGQTAIWQIIHTTTVFDICRLSDIPIDGAVASALRELSDGFATSSAVPLDVAQQAAVAMVRWSQAEGRELFDEANCQGRITWSHPA